VEIDRLDLCVMACVVMFGRIVSQIFVSRVPADVEFAIFYLVADVKIAHFHRARALPIYGTVGNACCSDVVAVNWCWWLGVP
jgi:hypothetical protein